MDLRETQKVVYKNKIDKGFNVTDVNKEFCLLYGEVAEAYDAWRKKKDDLGEELADIAIYLLGLSEILGIDLASEIENKIEINHEREYKNIDGVLKRVSERWITICLNNEIPEAFFRKEVLNFMEVLVCVEQQLIYKEK